MQELEGNTVKMIRLVQLELEVTGKIQIYFEQVKRAEDVNRVMNFFAKILADLAEK